MGWDENIFSSYSMKKRQQLLLFVGRKNTQHIPTREEWVWAESTTTASSSSVAVVKKNKCMEAASGCVDARCCLSVCRLCGCWTAHCSRTQAKRVNAKRGQCALNVRRRQQNTAFYLYYSHETINDVVLIKNDNLKKKENNEHNIYVCHTLRNKFYFLFLKIMTRKILTETVLSLHEFCSYWCFTNHQLYSMSRKNA